MDMGVKRLAVVLALLLLGLSAAFAQSVRINEVNPSGQWIELYNAGEEAVDVSTYQVCNRPAYAPVGNLPIVSGELTIAPGGFLVVEWDALAGDQAELGLYTEGAFSSADALVDYLEWGAAGGGRESVAVEAGLWQAGDFAELPGEGQSLIYSEVGEMGLGNWSAAEPTPGEANPGSE